VQIPRAVIPVRTFLLTPACLPEWDAMDLYLFRDDSVVFYVGQSARAYRRVWDHLFGSKRGRSLAGRFILTNWPGSLRFTIELMSSQDDEFAPFGGDLNAAERALIERHCPCFNEALNPNPTPLPTRYAPPNATMLGPRSVAGLVREAQNLVRIRAQRAADMVFGDAEEPLKY
jgi:hypothetical protein